VSLESPTKLERLAEWLTTASPTRRILVYCVIGLVVLGAVLFAFDRFTDWRVDRDTERRKANINAHLANAQTIEKGIANLNERLAAEKEAANIETQGYLDKVNASRDAREATNAALSNLANAKGVNTANSSAADLEKALENLK